MQQNGDERKSKPRMGPPVFFKIVEEVVYIGLGLLYAAVRSPF